MLSPRIRLHESPEMKFSPMIKAWPMPSGLAWTAYESAIPRYDPSPNSSSKRGVSCGVEMIRTSRIPASMRTESG